MEKRPVLLIQLGEAPDPVRAEHGCYPVWFERAWGGSLTVHDGRTGALPPDPRGFAGVVITGSARSLVDPEPWVMPSAELARRAHEAGTPVLGVCFGHQLVGWVFGGRVVKNPRGWEVGTCDVELTDHGASDPLFEGLPRSVRVNLTHRDMVCPDTLPSDDGGLRVLARNEMTPVQALAVGDHVRGIQFHPEVTGAVARGYIDARRHLLADRDPDAIRERTVDCPDGIAVMRNFRRNFVERA